MGDFAPVKQRAVTDCQKCGFLCLGPTIMACGHVICRKCLHERLVQKGKDALCPFCNFPVVSMEFDSEEEFSYDASALLDMLEQDVVLDDLVRSFTTKCANCQREASFACTDCQKYFCSICHLEHAGKEEFQSHETQAFLCASTAASSPSPRQETCSNADQEQQDSCNTMDSPAESSRATELRQKRDELMLLNRSFAIATGSIQHLRTEIEFYRQSVLHSINSLSDALLRVQEAQDRKDQQTRSTMESLENQQRLTDAYVSRLRSPSAAMLANPRQLSVRLKRLTTDCRELQVVANGKKEQLEKRMEMMVTVQSGIYSMLELVEKEARSCPDLDECIPQPVLKVVPCASGDWTKDSCQISSIAITSDGRLVMADRVNDSVKVWSHSAPSDVVSIGLNWKPLRLCVMDDNQVAVTGERNLLFVVDVDLKTFSSASTEQQYCGIGATTRDRLVVTCRDIANRVDLVNRCGQLLRTVTVCGDSLHHVHVTRPDEVLVSSHFQHCVHRIDLNTGRVVETLTSPDLQQPYQVAQDAEGNVYVASWGHRCLLVRLARDGTWRRLLDSNLFLPEYDRPAGIVLTGSRLVVTWDKLVPPRQSSLIACYDLI